MAVKRRYFLFLCSRCGEQHPYAGFCESCGTRLEMHGAIPVLAIEEFRDRSYQEPPLSTEQFVKLLLEFATTPST